MPLVLIYKNSKMVFLFLLGQFTVQYEYSRPISLRIKETTNMNLFVAVAADVKWQIIFVSVKNTV